MSDKTSVCNNKMQKNADSCTTNSEQPRANREDNRENNREQNRKQNRLHTFTMIASQIFAVILIAVPAALPIATAKISLTVCMLILLTFLAFWPLQGNIIDRIIALISGIASAWCATLALKGWLPQSVIIDYETVSMSKFIAAIHPYERWAVSFALILVAATFVTFIRQMLRENRTNLVRNLSHTLTASIACAALPGWLFLPSIIRFMPSLRSTDGGILVAALCTFMLIVLSGLSYLWVLRNRNEFYKGSVTKDIAFVIMPIMFSGMLVYIAGLGMLVAA